MQFAKLPFSLGLSLLRSLPEDRAFMGIRAGYAIWQYK
jgi:hypothetical protein